MMASKREFCIIGQLGAIVDFGTHARLLVAGRVNGDQGALSAFAIPGLVC
jgi:hypothetical protein